MNTRRRRFGGAESSSEDSEGLLPGGLTNVHHKSPQKTKWSSYIPLLAVFTVYVALLVAIFWHFPVIDEYVDDLRNSKYNRGLINSPLGLIALI